jgi:hypothetical protein
VLPLRARQPPGMSGLRALAGLGLVCLQKEATVGQDVVTEDRSAS